MELITNDSSLVTLPSSIVCLYSLCCTSWTLYGGLGQLLDNGFVIKPPLRVGDDFALIPTNVGSPGTLVGQVLELISVSPPLSPQYFTILTATFNPINSAYLLTFTPTLTINLGSTFQSIIYNIYQSGGTQFNVYNCGGSLTTLNLNNNEILVIPCSYDVQVISGFGYAESDPSCVCVTQTPTPTLTPTVTSTITQTPTNTVTVTQYTCNCYFINVPDIRDGVNLVFLWHILITRKKFRQKVWWEG